MRRGVVSQSGAVLLVETSRQTGLDASISAALAPWRKARAVHDPGKILLDVALAAIRRARAEVREWVWRLAGEAAPDPGGEVVVDIDGVLILAHSEKQDAAKTWKKAFGHHPLFAFVVDHGREGSGEPVAGLLRPGNAGSNTAADHIEAARTALAQLPNSAWTPAVESQGEVRDCAWVAELAGDVPTGWPKGMRLIVRK